MLVFLINILFVLAWVLAFVTINTLITNTITTGNVILESVAATLLVAMLCTLASFSYNMVLKK